MFKAFVWVMAVILLLILIPLIWILNDSDRVWSNSIHYLHHVENIVIMNVVLVVIGGLFFAGVITVANIVMYLQTRQWNWGTFIMEVLIAMTVGCLLSAGIHHYLFKGL
ncbi:hypothetical protein PP740_gp017 [Stenotrophomonas phage Philippe]|uniref:Membrane protein n=1 Tax=Stenotrophomonas phage Philippe TaxID=2859655 RepID=A0AAE8BJK6_9CAUD|nr:hypothetical protein PP740_gp017 [Stenotrophomonas phage Philippe]QYW02216.1 putative membrane protein [Stenotrophomonas phage Philippe]